MRSSFYELNISRWRLGVMIWTTKNAGVLFIFSTNVAAVRVCASAGLFCFQIGAGKSVLVFLKMVFFLCAPTSTPVHLDLCQHTQYGTAICYFNRMNLFLKCMKKNNRNGCSWWKNKRPKQQNSMHHKCTPTKSTHMLPFGWNIMT